MSTDKSNQAAASLFDRRFTAIIVLLAGYTVLASATLVWFDDLPTVARIPLALPILLVTPGYGLVTALFPTSARDSDTTPTAGRIASYVPDGLPLFERMTVAVVVSIAIVPFVALLVDVVIGFDITFVLAGVSLITVGASGIAVVRRLRSDDVPASGATSTKRQSVLTDKITIGALVVAVLLVGSTAAFALTAPSDRPDQTEFYVGNTTDTGEFVATGYPKAFELGEERTYKLKIRSNADDPRQYEIVALFGGADSSGTATELSRVTTTVQPGETATVDYPVAPTESGENLTVQFLLYQGSAPPNPTADTAHRILRISIDVTQSG